MTTRIAFLLVAACFVSACDRQPTREIRADNELERRLQSLESEVTELRVQVERLESRPDGAADGQDRGNGPFGGAMRERFFGGDRQQERPQAEAPQAGAGERDDEARERAQEERRQARMQAFQGKQERKGRESDPCVEQCQTLRKDCQKRVMSAKANERNAMIDQCREEVQACRQACRP